jgi:hypothetical protein
MMKILAEAHMLYLRLSSKSMETTFSIFDYQYYWQGANEAISSSYSHTHFGHYKAASFDKSLSTLHAAKLSACAKKGIPLTQWGVGLTVLLKKTQGNNNIHKMQAIVLLEGNFNCCMKLIFACRMMILAQDKGQIPIKCFAKKGSSCVIAIMTKIMMCDESRTHHHPMCIGGNDFGDCYDRVAHPPASIALQSWGVAQAPI